MADSIISGVSVAGEKVSVLASNIVIMRHIPQGMDAWPERTVIETRSGNVLSIVEDDNAYRDGLAQWKQAVLG